MKKILIALAALVIVAGGAAWLLINQGAQGEVDRMIARALESGAYQDIDYESVDVGMDGRIRLQGLRVVDAQGLEFGLQEVLVSDYDLEHEIPHFVSLEARGFSFPQGLPEAAPGQPAQLQRYLDGLGFNGEVIPLTVAYRYRYEPDNAHQLRNEVDFDLENSLSGEARSTIRQVPLENFMARGGMDPALAQMQLLASLSAAEIPGASVTLTDHGMVESMLATMSGEYGMDTDEVRGLLRSQLENLYLFAPEGLQDFAREAGAELAAFLEGNRTLNLSLTPQFEGSMQMLQPAVMAAFFSQDYAAIVDLLNVEIDTLEAPALEDAP